jgi:CheY-like chemotaxis protein
MAPGPKTILVVDDELDIREMLELALSFGGHEVISAEGGQRAVELARARRIDLVICDIKMPGMDGVQAISALRHVDPAMTILVATGYLSPDTIEECVQLGVKVFLRKPFTMVELDQALTSAFGRD